MTTDTEARELRALTRALNNSYFAQPFLVPIPITARELASPASSKYHHAAWRLLDRDMGVLLELHGHAVSKEGCTAETHADALLGSRDHKLAARICKVLSRQDGIRIGEAIPMDEERLPQIRENIMAYYQASNARPVPYGVPLWAAQAALKESLQAQNSRTLHLSGAIIATLPGEIAAPLIDRRNNLRVRGEFYNSSCVFTDFGHLLFGLCPQNELVIDGIEVNETTVPMFGQSVTPWLNKVASPMRAQHFARPSPGPKFAA